MKTLTESETIMIDYPLLIVSLLLSILAQLL